jgi:hypothetical protein
VASDEAVPSSAPDGENSITWFGPNVIRTMTSARSAPVMPDIMDHVAMPNAAGARPVTGLGPLLLAMLTMWATMGAETLGLARTPPT